MKYLRQTILIIVLLLVLIGLAAVPSPLPGRIGAGDFTAYWSASYLLAHGLNFSDPVNLLQIESEMAGWREAWPIVTWNPPYLLALLIPLAVLSFKQAAWIWLVLCICCTYICCILLWRSSAIKPGTKRLSSIAPFIGFIFVPTLLGLLAGQVNFFVLCGLVGFLHFSNRRQFGRAGVFLALTMVKPHLVYLTLMIVLLKALSERWWSIFTGFVLSLCALTSVVFILRPSFPVEYLVSTSAGTLLAWETPTLGGMLDALFGWPWFKLMGMILAPLAIGFWWRTRRQWDARTLLDVTVLFSVVTAPFGWSYDFVILLIPLIHIMTWQLDGIWGRRETMLIWFLLSTALGAMFYFRTVMTNEIAFFWVPVVLAAIYLYVAHRAESPSLQFYGATLTDVAKTVTHS